MMKKKFLLSAVITTLTFNSYLSYVNAHTHELTLGKLPEQEQISDSKVLLMKKLSDLNFFSADFTQQVVNESGDIIEQSTGKLAISKPNLAHWQVLSPDELSIVSDGEDVWFYNPWIEQVSIYSLSAAIARTPILLLTSKDENLWQQYNVAKNSNSAQHNSESYTISAKDKHSQIKSLTLIFNNQVNGGQLSQFSFLDATGQLSHVTLKKFDDKQKPQADFFRFDVPDDVQIDDQR
ncbi:MAG: outer membrane lipoprotein chaperone LolA [Litorilituus sp.]|nr:outer membrane lipoprotein chaperone LolA [Litorilituus sp.]